MPKIPEEAFRNREKKEKLYKNWAKNRGHAYDAVPSNISYADRILAENRKKEVFKELQNFLRQEKGLSAGEAEKTAEQMLNKGGKKAAKTIAEAEAEGYLPDFRLHEPWHPKPFLNGSLITYPYQHDSVIVYTGINKHMFFKEDSGKRFSGSRAPSSIIKTGKIPPTNDHKGVGNYLGFLEVAKHYAKKSRQMSDHEVGGAVLEVQIPTEKLITIVDQMGRYKNLSELRERFETPEQFWRKCQDTRLEEIHFKVEGNIPLDWITGVWDTENNQKPIFTPLDDFLKTLSSQYIEDMPDEELAEKERQEILEEMDVYKELFQALKQVKDGYSNIEHPPIGKDRRQLISEYNNALENANKVLAQEFGFNPNPAEASYKEVKESSQKVESLIIDAAEGLKEALADEQQHIHETDWDREKIKEEKIFEKQVEKRLAEKIMKIPLIRMD